MVLLDTLLLGMVAVTYVAIGAPAPSNGSISVNTKLFASMDKENQDRRILEELVGIPYESVQSYTELEALLNEYVDKVLNEGEISPRVLESTGNHNYTNIPKPESNIDNKTAAQSVGRQDDAGYASNKTSGKYLETIGGQTRKEGDFLLESTNSKDRAENTHLASEQRKVTNRIGKVTGTRGRPVNHHKDLMNVLASGVNSKVAIGNQGAVTIKGKAVLRELTANKQAKRSNMSTEKSTVGNMVTNEHVPNTTYGTKASKISLNKDQGNYQIPSIVGKISSKKNVAGIVGKVRTTDNVPRTVDDRDWKNNIGPGMATEVKKNNNLSSTADRIKTNNNVPIMDGKRNNVPGRARIINDISSRAHNIKTQRGRVDSVRTNINVSETVNKGKTNNNVSGTVDKVKTNIHVPVTLKKMNTDNQERSTVSKVKKTFNTLSALSKVEAKNQATITVAKVKTNDNLLSAGGKLVDNHVTSTLNKVRVSNDEPSAFGIVEASKQVPSAVTNLKTDIPVPTGADKVGTNNHKASTVDKVRTKYNMPSAFGKVEESKVDKLRTTNQVPSTESNMKTDNYIPATIDRVTANDQVPNTVGKDLSNDIVLRRVAKVRVDNDAPSTVNNMLTDIIKVVSKVRANSLEPIVFHSQMLGRAVVEGINQSPKTNMWPKKYLYDSNDKLRSGNRVRTLVNQTTPYQVKSKDDNASAVDNVKTTQNSFDKVTAGNQPKSSITLKNALSDVHQRMANNQEPNRTYKVTANNNISSKANNTGTIIHLPSSVDIFSTVDYGEAYRRDQSQTGKTNHQEIRDSDRAKTNKQQAGKLGKVNVIHHQKSIDIKAGTNSKVHMISDKLTNNYLVPRKSSAFRSYVEAGNIVKGASTIYQERSAVDKARENRYESGIVARMNAAQQDPKKIDEGSAYRHVTRKVDVGNTPHHVLKTNNKAKASSQQSRILNNVRAHQHAPSTAIREPSHLVIIVSPEETGSSDNTNKMRNNYHVPSHLNNVRTNLRFESIFDKLNAHYNNSTTAARFGARKNLPSVIINNQDTNTDTDKTMANHHTQNNGDNSREVHLTLIIDGNTGSNYQASGKIAMTNQSGDKLRTIYQTQSAGKQEMTNIQTPIAGGKRRTKYQATSTSKSAMSTHKARHTDGKPRTKYQARSRSKTAMSAHKARHTDGKPRTKYQATGRSKSAMTNHQAKNTGGNRRTKYQATSTSKSTMPKYQARNTGGKPRTKYQATSRSKTAMTKYQAGNTGGKPRTKYQARSRSKTAMSAHKARHTDGKPRTKYQARSRSKTAMSAPKARHTDGKPRTKYQATGTKESAMTNHQARNTGGKPRTKYQARSTSKSAMTSPQARNTVGNRRTKYQALSTIKKSTNQALTNHQAKNVGGKQRTKYQTTSTHNKFRSNPHRKSFFLSFLYPEEKVNSENTARSDTRLLNTISKLLGPRLTKKRNSDSLHKKHKHRRLSSNSKKFLNQYDYPSNRHYSGNGQQTSVDQTNLSSARVSSPLVKETTVVKNRSTSISDIQNITRTLPLKRRNQKAIDTPLNGKYPILERHQLSRKGEKSKTVASSLRQHDDDENDENEDDDEEDSDEASSDRNEHES